MTKTTDQPSLNLTLVLLFLSGLCIRLLLAAVVPHANDIDAWQHYSSYWMTGSWSPYDEVQRYKYSPVWFWIITLTSMIAHKTGLGFVFLIRLPIILTDICIFFLLAKVCHKLSMTLKKTNVVLASFFLNPISLQLSGYSGQFDNISVFFVLLAWFFHEFTRNKSVWLYLPFLSVSVSIKHFSMMLVPLFALLRKKLRQIVLILIAPPAAFLAILIPYFLISDPHWVSYNVFKYNLHAGYWGWSGVICRGVLFFTDFDLIQQPWFHYLDHFNSVLYAAMIVSAFWIVKRFDLLDSILIMFLIFYSFTTQIAPQYTIWIIPFAAIRPNRYFYLYSLTGGFQIAAFYYCHHFWFRHMDFTGPLSNFMPETFIFFRYLTWLTCVLWFAHFLKRWQAKSH